MNSYLDLLKAKKSLKQEQSHSLEILVLTNITINPLKDYLEYQCGVNGIKAEIEFGDYDNIVQNAQERDLKGKIVIVFWELANAIHGLEYKIDSMDPEQLHSLENKIKSELSLTFNALSNASLVIMNRFTSLPFSFQQTESGALEHLAERLNQYCSENAADSIKWINSDKCLVHSGIHQSIDYKGYLKNKWLYKHDFFWHYSQLIQPYLNAVSGKVKKLLALDCDNTLWKGILGEDGMEGIQMDENGFKGQVFAAAQYRALAMAKNGILLALASKNNPEEVDQVLLKHSDNNLTDKKLVAKKVNWDPKGENLESLAKELNIGLDSFVFVDDSDFEIQMMRDQYPQVHCIQVSKNDIEYYLDQISWSNNFVQLNRTAEDHKKLEQYQQNAKRADEEQKHSDFASFLEALDLKITLYRNTEEIIPRMAQMTQKTNQFNLTTQRYSEAQIKEFTKANAYDLFAFGVKDKFGDSGVTGLCIVEYKNEELADLDSLLMSCRILGRNIEFRFVEEVLAEVFKKVDQIIATFIPTKKNAQVANFYEKLGFVKSEESDGKTIYTLNKESFKPSTTYNYINLQYA